MLTTALSTVGFTCAFHASSEIITCATVHVLAAVCRGWYRHPVCSCGTLSLSVKLPGFTLYDGFYCLCFRRGGEVESAALLFVQPVKSGAISRPWMHRHFSSVQFDCLLSPRVWIKFFRAEVYVLGRVLHFSSVLISSLAEPFPFMVYFRFFHLGINV